MGAWVALKSLEQSQVIQLRGLKPPITTASPVSLASFTSLAGTSLFTDRIIASLPNRDTLSESVVYRPSRYGEPYPYSLALLSDAAKHRIAPDGLDLEGPDSAVVAALSPSPDLPPFCTEHHVHQPQECPTPPSQAFHFLHGSQDLDVSPSDSFHLAKACSKMYSTCDGPVQSRVVIVDEADHRLSDPRSLSALEAVLKRVGADSIQAGAVSVT
ncbi:hypothetical protein M427DRAFT_51979 [Gonapodya prolifera JEL478]|uniref:Uncharacterized protein n=1 Tax=Gonapodya prolifera (strain JEL478) TaxID=1344416 RepID=A0A139AWD4_GONPJ|nr:hypothetical protein M427DRAFT_51979 [Gonapodya prolifera JEL478]|eukprot:KXS21046.1 hypothetical protein M427DRAFT_51979 [Gonapodya prolifera JEL478]